MQDDSRFCRSCCFGRNVRHLYLYMFSHTHISHTHSNLFVCSIKSSFRCYLLTDALGKLSSGRKMNQNGLQVKSVMLFSTRPLDLFSPSLFPKKFFHIDAAHMRNCRAILDLADCVDGLHGCIELWSCDAFLCFIVPIIRCTGTHTHTRTHAAFSH